MSDNINKERDEEIAKLNIEKYIEIPKEVKKNIKEQLKKSYDLFGKDKYIENFLSFQKEALERFRHWQTLSWTIITLYFTISFALVDLTLFFSPVFKLVSKPES